MQGASNAHGSVGALMGQHIKVTGGVHIVNQNSAHQGYWGVGTFLVDSTCLCSELNPSLNHGSPLRTLSPILTSLAGMAVAWPITSNNKRWSVVIRRIFSFVVTIY